MGDVLASALGAAVGGAVGSLISFFLGRSQGFKQARYEKSAEVLPVMLGLAQDVDRKLLVLEAMKDLPERPRASAELVAKVRELGTFYRANVHWLDLAVAGGVHTVSRLRRGGSRAGRRRPRPRRRGIQPQSARSRLQGAQGPPGTLPGDRGGNNGALQSAT